MAVVDGATVVIGPPLHRGDGGDGRQPGLHLLPAEAVDHEQHDLVGVGQQRREPPRCLVGRPQQRRHDVGDAGPAVVGQYEVVHAVQVLLRATVTAAPPVLTSSSRRAPRFARPQPVQLCPVKVSTRGDYASRALLSLALHDDLGPHVRPRHRRAHRPPPALPRADPAGAEGRRARPLQAGRRRRLRPRPRARDDHARRHRQRGRRPDRRRRLRRAPPERRLRPRGPVRPAVHLGRWSATTCAATSTS